MIMFLKNGENIEIDDDIYEKYQSVRNLPPKQKKEAVFYVDDKKYTLHDVKFIGSWCHNEKCSNYNRSGVNAHPEGEYCDYDYTGKCEVCGKKMWPRDCEYSNSKFQRVVCYKHSPMGGIPKSDNLSQRTRDAAVAALPDNASEERIGRLNQLIKESKI